MQDDWFSQNLAATRKRLEWLADKPSGIILYEPSAKHEIVIRKEGSHIHLIFLDPTADIIMSRMDIQNPLFLLAPYAQAMMLGLLWASEPRRVYVIGFGGGRIPMILHHYFPDVVVESAEIDASVVAIAREYFGTELDARLRVVIQDGREYLAGHNPDLRYDMIVMDAQRGTSDSPYHLATREFYQLCGDHLNPDGVVVANVLPEDSLYWEKVKTMVACFRTVHSVVVEGTNVFFLSNGADPCQGEWVRRAEAIESKHRFLFPFAEHAADLYLVSGPDGSAPQLAQARILTDAAPPAGYFDRIPAESTIFSKARAGEPCPCGSGKGFEECHGPRCRGQK